MIGCGYGYKGFIVNLDVKVCDDEGEDDDDEEKRMRIWVQSRRQSLQ